MKTIAITKGWTTTVDDADYEDVSQWKWYYTCGYVGRNVWNGKKQVRVYLHRYLMKPEPGIRIDHIDGNPLNNQRNNLRFATRSQNAQNSRPQRNKTSSKYKGVFLHSGKYWQAKVKVEGKTVHIGYFKTEVDAARAYDEAAKHYFGEYAWCNFPR